MRPHSQNTALNARRTDDSDRIRRLLGGDPFLALYMLGDLEPAYASFCVWWVAERADGAQTPGDAPEDVAALLVYTGYAEPVVLTWGAPEGISTILAASAADLPHRALIHLLPEHIEAVDRVFELDRLRPMVRLGRDAAALTLPTAPPGHAPPELLGPRDTGDIRELLQHYPDRFFEPHQLTAGVCLGIRDADHRLVAMAGTHLVSRLDGVAAIGNVVTHPDHRRRGLALACTSALVALLTAEGVPRLGLTCARHNTAAMALGRRLGFREHATYLEGAILRDPTAVEPGR